MPTGRDVFDKIVQYFSDSPAQRRLRMSSTRQPLELNLEINEYGPCAEIFIVHGLYNTTTIAS